MRTTLIMTIAVLFGVNVLASTGVQECSGDSLELREGDAVQEKVSQTTTIKNVRLAMKAGDSKGMSKYFAKMVELKTDAEEGDFSKDQAAFVLKSFFKKFPPSEFEYNHQGSSPGGAIYTIGTYKAGQKSFRVYMKYVKVGENYQMDSLEFTKE